MTLPVDKFDGAWRAASAIVKCPVKDVETFLQRHYLGKRPAITTLCLRMDVEGVARGAIVYALPPRESDKRYGGKTWELARLWIADEVPRNAETWLIGQSVRFIKKHHPEIAFLLSYADPSVGHAGTIYKAANWKADGKTDDERKTARFDYAHPVTGKKYARRKHVPIGVTPVRVPRVSKHRFVLKVAP